MSEKPKHVMYSHPHSEVVGKGLILHNGKFWEVVVEEINPLVNFNNDFNIHFYITIPRCISILENNLPCLHELNLIDLGICYLEKCDNCSYKRLTLKSHKKERSEVYLKIDALITRNNSKINNCYDLINLLNDEKEL